MTAHVVSFTPAGAPTRAVCSCGWVTAYWMKPHLKSLAEGHAFMYRGSVEFAGLPPVERAS